MNSTCLVYVLVGPIGPNNCHIEVFAGTESGYKLACQRRDELLGMNPGWPLKILTCTPKDTPECKPEWRQFC